MLENANVEVMNYVRIDTEEGGIECRFHEDYNRHEAPASNCNGCLIVWVDEMANRNLSVDEIRKFDSHLHGNFMASITRGSDD